MNRNSKAKRDAINKANKNAPRKSEANHPKVGRRREGLSGPTIHDQLVMLGYIKES
jgi:hypothetical protein